MKIPTISSAGLQSVRNKLLESLRSGFRENNAGGELNDLQNGVVSIADRVFTEYTSSLPLIPNTDLHSNLGLPQETILDVERLYDRLNDKIWWQVRREQGEVGNVVSDQIFIAIHQAIDEAKIQVGMGIRERQIHSERGRGRF